MATPASSYNVSLQPPPTFSFDVPDEWPKWRRRFEQFRVASGLSKEDEIQQVSTLLYCLGEEANDILASTNITDDDRKKYSEVLAKFDGHFKVRKNVIFERARFNRRQQEDGETVEYFISSLYQLSEDCQYGNMRNELIRDRLVVGIHDVQLSERLQTDENLTLDKAKKVIRQRDAVREQQSILKRREDPSLSCVGKKPSVRPANRAKCSRCGKTHQRNQCPAKDMVCYKCHRRGHFGKLCFSKTIAAVSEETPTDIQSETSEEPSDYNFLDVVSSQSSTTTAWHIRANVNDREVVFKIDTGAEVTAISRDAYKAIGHPNCNPLARYSVALTSNRWM